MAGARLTHSSSHYPNARWVRFSSVLEDEQQTVFKGEALLLEDVGVSVISDIGTSTNLPAATTPVRFIAHAQSIGSSVVRVRVFR